MWDTIIVTFELRLRWLSHVYGSVSVDIPNDIERAMSKLAKEGWEPISSEYEHSDDATRYILTYKRPREESKE